MIVRQEGFELTNGTMLIATIPKVGRRSTTSKALSKLALSLKHEYPDVDDASVLLEPEIQYDYLIQVMDAIRSAEVTAEDGVTTPAAGTRAWTTPVPSASRSFD